MAGARWQAVQLCSPRVRQRLFSAARRKKRDAVAQRTATDHTGRPRSNRSGAHARGCRRWRRLETLRALRRSAPEPRAQLCARLARRRVSSASRGRKRASSERSLILRAPPSAVVARCARCPALRRGFEGAARASHLRRAAAACCRGGVGDARGCASGAQYLLTTCTCRRRLVLPEGAKARRPADQREQRAAMPSQSRRKGGGAAQRTRSAALAGVLLLRPASAFSCLRSGTTCTALGDLYAATNGAGWELPNAAGVGVPPQAWAEAAAGKATDFCTFEGAVCDSANNLVSLCAPGPRCPARRRCSAGRPFPGLGPGCLACEGALTRCLRPPQGAARQRAAGRAAVVAGAGHDAHQPVRAAACRFSAASAARSRAALTAALPTPRRQ
jgi:hypothetical protein